MNGIRLPAVLAGAAGLCLLAAEVRAGAARSENFLVLTPSGVMVDNSVTYADVVLDRAEQYRKELAMDLFGTALPQGVGPAIINFSLDDKNRGLTWAKDDPARTHHVVYLSGDPATSLDGPLRHEMVHVLLATRFEGNRLDAWVEEGIASRYDDMPLIRRRRDIVESWVRNNKFPSIERVLSAENIAAQDQQAYAVSATLIDFLLARGDRTKLLAFAEAVTQKGIDSALLQHYRLRDVASLETEWQDWLRQNAGVRTAAR